jgi:hypothetical protein
MERRVENRQTVSGQAIGGGRTLNRSPDGTLSALAASLASREPETPALTQLWRLTMRTRNILFPFDERELSDRHSYVGVGVVGAIGLLLLAMML